MVAARALLLFGNGYLERDLYQSGVREGPTNGAANAAAFEGNSGVPAWVKRVDVA